MSEETLEIIIGLVYEISLYLGIIGFITLIYSFLTGMRYVNPKPKFKLHKRISIIGAILMAIHSIVMIFFKYLLKYFI